MLSEPGMKGLSWRERRTVKRAVARGRRLRDPRLVAALADLARWYRDRSWAASLRWLALALPPALAVGALVGSRLGAHPGNMVLAVLLGALASELGINRRVRRRQGRDALARYGLNEAEEQSAARPGGAGGSDRR
jgi:hypothetical protein